MDWILDAIIDEIEKNLKLYSSVKDRPAGMLL